MQGSELLLIGAGPYGLTVAAHAKNSGIEVTVAGEPMAFWKHNVPSGMLFRSGIDWHLDAGGLYTIEAFLEERRIARSDVEPIPVAISRRIWGVVSQGKWNCGTGSARQAIAACEWSLPRRNAKETRLCARAEWQPHRASRILPMCQRRFLSIALRPALAELIRLIGFPQ